jgi:hypothetical protein
LTSGGKRKGAGRKKLPYKTKTISFRIKPEWEQKIKKVVRAEIKKLKSDDTK